MKKILGAALALFLLGGVAEAQYAPPPATAFTGGELTSALVFEGATADAFETTLTVVDPTTPDKTITLPNLTGTVTVDQNPATATYTSSADSIILNADVDSDGDGIIQILSGVGAVVSTTNADSDNANLSVGPQAFSAIAALAAGDSAYFVVDAASSDITLDADFDGDSDGTITLTTDNTTNKIALSNTGITATVEGAAVAFPATAGTLVITIDTGALAFNPGSTASGACAAAITDTATGTATTDVISWTFNADPTSTTGYDPSGDLGYIVAYPTANTVNFKFCNKSGSAIDPGSVTLNWRVDR